MVIQAPFSPVPHLKGTPTGTVVLLPPLLLLLLLPLTRWSLAGNVVEVQLKEVIWRRVKGGSFGRKWWWGW